MFYMPWGSLEGIYAVEHWSLVRVFAGLVSYVA